MKKTKTLLAVLSFLSFQNSNAQTDSSQTQKPQFKFSINFNSGLNYYGRTDSLKSTGTFPLAEFWITPNFYINAAPVFITNALQSFEYAGTVTTLGYQTISEKWLSNFYVLKPFYKQSSQLVQSALKAQTGFTVSRLNKVLNVTIGADAKFSDKIDFGASAGLDHIFRIENKDNSVLVIDPSLYVYAGTQNFTTTYNKKKTNLLPFPPGNQPAAQGVQQFNVLAYEASLPLVYAKGKWMLLATPAYIIPQNLITVQDRPDLSEKGQDMFYATLGVKYTF